jgi:hypothetical protein
MVYVAPYNSFLRFFSVKVDPIWFKHISPYAWNGVDSNKVPLKDLYTMPHNFK